MSPASVWEKPFSSFRSGDTHQQAWCHVNCKHDQKPAKFCWWHWDQSQVLFCWMSLSSLPISCNWEYRGEAHLYWFLNPSSWSRDVFDFLLSLCCLPEKSVMAEGLSRTGTFPFTAWSQGCTKLCEEVGLVYILGLLLPSDGSVKHAVQF